ncbi:nuclease [Priestia sp. YIM B13551]|uniref:nuclease n=1 Tax=Priestia sp. YIM B13551 TaxID=3366306 RepID=UPI00366D12B6
MKEKILITSLARVSENTPWRVGMYLNDNYTFFNVGEKGNVAMSPRFSSFLAEVEKKVSRYPVDVSFHSQTENREMDITKIREQIVYVDCNHNALRLIQNARFYYGKEVLGNPLAVKLQKETANTFSILNTVKGSIASTALQYIAVGRVENVRDGDTIDVTLLRMSDFLESRFGKNAQVAIRYNGVDTPEKHADEPNAYKDGENTATGKDFGVTMEDMYEIADEGYKFNMKTLGYSESNKPLVILDFDREKDGADPLLDAGYGRYISDVYATSEKNADIAMEKVSKGNKFVHVPKSLLTTYSKKFPHIPLGMFSAHFAVEGDTVLNPFDWVSELGLKTFDPSGQLTAENLKDYLSADTGISQDSMPYSENINQDTINFDTSTGPAPNNLDFFEPYDDRLSVFTKGIKTTEDIKKHSKVRIGDVILTIPPTSIEVNKTSNISKIKTLRTKSSVLVNRGQTLTTLAMDLYFHDLESINGTKLPWKQGNFFVDGLRPLLAQFTKTPFVPIDNYYINDVIGIRDVALMDIEVTTVPNFPESLTVRITLVEFNSEAYLMDHDSLGNAINYPMMRWFYNQAMSSRDEKYRYFKAIEGPISSDISFTIADEEYLALRKNAIQKIKSVDSPEEMKIKLKENVSYKAKKEDKSVVAEILDQYELYSESNIKEYTIIDDVSTLHTNLVADQLQQTYKIKKETAENATKEGVELYTSIYDGKYKDENLASRRNIFIPYESHVFYPLRFDINWFEGLSSAFFSEPPVDYTKEPYKGTQKKGLFVVDKLSDPDNQAKLEKSFKKYYDSDKKRFFLPATSDVVKALKDVEGSAKDMEDAIDDYEEDFNATVAIIDASESGVPMKNYPISGTVVPVSLNVRFSNEFSVAHVQAGEAATLQYMGGGDPYLDLILEVDEEAAKDFNKLITLSDYYAKTYNQGITNGFIGVQNDLAQLFSLRYIMIENIAINTVPGFPGRYQLMIKAIGFDKTQRQREELRGLPGNSKQMDSELLEENKGAFANDRMLEARLSKLEVYPDLELPTYDELNAILPDLDAGDIDEYVNQTGGTYVDPDFYISTVSTMRKLIEESYQNDHRVNMYDATGVGAYTSSGDMEKLFDTTDADWEKLKALEKEDGVQPLGWVFKWQDGQDDSSAQATDTSAGTIVSDKGGDLKVSNNDIKSFLTSETDNSPNYYKFPTEKEWNKLFPSSEYDYDTYSSKPNPSEAAIYKELDKLVDKYFKKYYSAPKFIEECRGDLKSADKSKKKVSYAPPNEFYIMNFPLQLRKLGTGDMKKVNTLTKDKKITYPSAKESDAIKDSDFGKTDYKITKERFMTLMKAFLDKMSGWQHYKGKNPMVSRIGRAGLAQVDISGQDFKLDEAKRLIYNWRYNLDVAVKQLATHYKAFTALKKDCTNFEVWCRPWDAMFALYEKPDEKNKILTSANITASDYANSIMNRFNNYATKPFNTPSGFNKEIYREFAGLSKEEEKSIGYGDKTDYVTSLLDLDYYKLSVLKDAGLTVESDKKNIRKAMKKYLEQKSFTKENLFSVYQDHLKMLYNLANTDSKVEKVVDGAAKIASFVPAFKLGSSVVDNTTDVLAGDKKDKNGYAYSKDIYEKGAKLYLSIKNVDDTAEASQQAIDTRLYNDVDPRTIYQEMFHDLRYHDQRGRMVRAFPGFQMFIVHEGAYIGKYKFWDNMYGYNALQSIDVYRSRKIAADTAVISMTNVYSNLTTRRTDVDYIDHELKWWDNLVWNEIPQDLIDKKENEIHKNINLETGARIHLRMGYGATANTLPVVFNGTITELEIGDLIEIVAQGDGVELGNVISGDPDDTNKTWFKTVEEPRDLICSLLSSKGSWFKDVLNGATDGQLFRNNPLGIMHFGQPWNTEDNDATASKPLGNIWWFNDDYGEIAQNIYSSNGSPTFSQWLQPNGERNDIFHDFSWSRLWENKFKLANPGDEKNVVVKFYNNTVWDIIQMIAYTSPDYIAAVHPFELRSTLFFGKPYWRAAFQYDSRYEFDAINKTWSRHLEREARRPYMQHKFYTSAYDIISNNIKASEENIYTNVIVNYDGKQTPVLYADADIRYDKQKTRVIEADIVATFGDYYTSEVMATYYGNSALRDNLKDMYKGNILVMGDPTVKPHDMMYIGDNIVDLQGNALVKSVTHHFSLETGFVTSIEPDLLIVNDDQVILEIGKWYYSFASSLATTAIMKSLAVKGTRNLINWTTKANGIPSNVAKWSSTKGLRHQISLASDGSKHFEDAIKTMDKIIAAGDKDTAALYQQLEKQLESAHGSIPKLNAKAGLTATKDIGRKAVLFSALKHVQMVRGTGDVVKIGKSLATIAKGAASVTPVGLIVNSALWIGSEMIFEHYRRFKENLQCVTCIPLSYRGQELTAGINNHAGMVYGDNPGRYDRLFGATFGQDDGDDVEGTFGKALFEIANAITGTGGEYADKEKEQELNKLATSTK